MKHLITVTTFSLLLLSQLSPASALAEGCATMDGAKARADMGGTMNIVETAQSAGNFNTLTTALKATNLDQALQADGPFTVFAPTDEAFAKLPAGTLESLLSQPDKLANILKYHVVAGKKASSELKNQMELETLQGEELKINIKDQKLMVSSANITNSDIKTSNGVIHVIDTVLIP